MNSKQFLFGTALWCAAIFTIQAQDMGNVNYDSNRYHAQQQNMVTVTAGNPDELTFSIRGIYNEKPGLYSATFSMVQVGTSLEEIDGLMAEKIKNIKTSLTKADPGIEVITDMISFVPVYEYEVSKKLFNKKTYNEKPAGYELKKNLIIKYKKPVLDAIISACAKEEVYDFVKTDYVLTNLDAIQAKLQAKTLEEFAGKLKYYSTLKGEDLLLKKRNISESYNLAYPVESYARYTAFTRNQLPFSRNSLVNETAKNETQYYNPVMAKAHTFVINPEITEPAVQIFYDLVVTIDLRKPEAAKPAVAAQPAPKKIYVITQNGDVRELAL